MPHVVGVSVRGRENSDNAGQLDFFYIEGLLYYNRITLLYYNTEIREGYRKT